MGTKLTELRNGCFHAAMDDEPMFVLLARDPSAPDLVEQWARIRESEIERQRRPRSDMEQVLEARETAQRMRQWRADNDGAWRVGQLPGMEQLVPDDPASNVTIDPRPANCRNALRDGGKAYPKSGCAVCQSGGMTGCPYERNPA